MNSKVFKTAIVLSWIFLGICFLLKLGSLVPFLNKFINADTFAIVCTNETFIKICNYLDNHYIIQCLVYFPIFILSNTLYYLAVCRQKWFKRKQTIIAYVTLNLVYIAKCILPTFTIIYDVTQLLILPFILLLFGNKKFLNILSGFIFNLAFQLVSMYIKDIGLGMIDENSLTGLIFMVDTIIMLLLYYLYSVYYNKENMQKEEDKDGKTV